LDLTHPAAIKTWPMFRLADATRLQFCRGCIPARCGNSSQQPMMNIAMTAEEIGRLS
jgi:hypothetical protein